MGSCLKALTAALMLTVGVTDGETKVVNTYRYFSTVGVFREILELLQVKRLGTPDTVQHTVVVVFLVLLQSAWSRPRCILSIKSAFPQNHVLTISTNNLRPTTFGPFVAVPALLAHL